jgi:hypothetical protein
VFLRRGHDKFNNNEDGLGNEYKPVQKYKLFLRPKTEKGILKPFRLCLRASRLLYNEITENAVRLATQYIIFPTPSYDRYFGIPVFCFVFSGFYISSSML